MNELIRRVNQVMAEQTRLIAERQRLGLEIHLWSQQTLQRHERTFKWDNGIFYESSPVSSEDSESRIRIAGFPSTISPRAITTLDFASAFLSFADQKREFAAAKIAFADEKRRFAAARLGFAAENPGSAVGM